MSTVRQIYELLRWELRLELRDKFALGSVGLYVVATTVIVYASLAQDFAQSTARVIFNSYYWVIVFFGATVAAGRSFLREGGRRHFYYYTLADPLALLISKLLYNLLLIYLISVLTYVMLTLFARTNVIVNPLPFVAAVLLGGLGLSAILTFVSALAARAGGSGTLMAILSFPLVIPLLRLLVTAGSFGIDEGSTDVWQPIYLMVAVDLLALAMGIILFPFVWRD